MLVDKTKKNITKEDKILTNNLFNQMLETENNKSENNDIIKLIGLALIFEGKNDLKNAASCYVKAILLNKFFPLAHVKLGNILLALGKSKEAQNAYQNAVILDPESADNNFLFAEVLHKNNDFLNAYRFYKKTFTIDHRASAAFGMATIFIKNKQYKEAISIFEEILKVEPNNFQVLSNLAICYSNLNDNEKAIKLINKSLKISKNSLSSKISGDIYQRIGDYKSAIEMYDEAMKDGLNNIYFSIRSTQAKLLLLTQNYERGFKLYSPILIRKGENKDSIEIINKFLINHKELTIAENKKILVLANGDAAKDLFFIRFLNKDFKNTTKANITLQCNDNIKYLIENNSNDIVIDSFTNKAELQDYDYVANIESIPFLLKIKNQKDLIADKYCFSKGFKETKTKKLKVAVVGNISDEFYSLLEDDKDLECIKINSLKSDSSNIKDVLKVLNEVNYVISLSSDAATSNLSSSIGLNTFIVEDVINWQFGSYSETNPFSKKQYVFRGFTKADINDCANAFKIFVNSNKR